MVIAKTSLMQNILDCLGILEFENVTKIQVKNFFCLKNFSI